MAMHLDGKLYYHQYSKFQNSNDLKEDANVVVIL